MDHILHSSEQAQRIIREVNKKNNSLHSRINELKDKTCVLDGWVEDFDSLQNVDINKNVV